MVPHTLIGSGISADRVVQLLQRTSRELRELDLGTCVDRVPLSRLTPLTFATEYVQRNKPVIITGAIDSWPASQLWDEHYLTNHPAGSAVVTVDVTPNGRGDAVTAVVDSVTGAPHRWFVTPYERRMTLREFFQLMRDTRRREERRAAGGTTTATREVPYMQHQNSNLSEELGELLGDIEPGLPWAEEVFGGPPEATNLWIGDGRSATSFHKDHYENLYAVLRGSKIFTLLPPCDAYRMYLVRSPAASYMPRRDVPSGATYAEVSTRPGGVVVETAEARRITVVEGVATKEGTAATEDGAVSAAAAKASVMDGGDKEAERRLMDDDDDDDDGRLVAVLQDPPYEVLWSAVDMTAEADPKARRMQPLFFGEAAAADGNGSCSEESETVAGTAERLTGRQGGELHAGGAGSDDDQEEEEEEADEQEQDPWYKAGGAPLVAEVGPGEVLYLPSLWYHQVEQRTADEAGGRGLVMRPGWGKQQQQSRSGAGGQRAGGAQGAAAPRAQNHREEDRTLTELGKKEDQEEPEEEPEEYVIAVNFWYDMKYDSRYAAFKLVEGLATMAGLAEEAPQRESG